ncbi:MAG: RNA polymerase subunit sigma-70, partial [Clostridia bacterium]|nr:RNA polymerase subunit sigma-70 [Clostridia bacterium]
MNEVQKEELINLKNEGRSYKEMASALFVSEGAIKSFFRREKLKTEGSHAICKNCGTSLGIISGNKKFCSDSCRYKWWRNNTIDNRKCVKI